ncbi:MAG: DUF2961 domain-containing protein [Sedimentisphaerales bacterium]|nr:DUF2961 domain-containing protein [Sedimentisphaerales bacterium]
MKKNTLTTMIVTCAVLLVIAMNGKPARADLSEERPGPFGILRLPARFESHRATFRQNISRTDETVVAEMEGEGCLRHMWLTIKSIRTQPVHGLYLTLRIYFDGNKQPYVEMPVAPFFGIHHGHEARHLDSPYIQVTDRSGFNCYFPMPYRKGMRITLQNDGPIELMVWFQADYHHYTSGPLKEDLRFQAAYRRVNPNEAYGAPHHLGHGVGRGLIIGTTIGWRVFDRRDAWYHCGGDLALLDGNSANARVLSGIGGEDFFGTAWGQDVFSNRSIGTPYYDVVKKPAQGEPHIVFAAYRFFDRDPIAFSESFNYDFGTLANDVSSVLYWYQAGGPARISTLPTLEDRLAGIKVPEGKYDLPRPQGLTWQLCGPFSCESKDEFERSEFPERGIDLTKTEPADFGQYAEAVRRKFREPMLTRWHSDIRSTFNFVDVTPSFRSGLKTNAGFPADVSAYAATTLHSDTHRSIQIRIGHDDWFKLWINGEEVYSGEELNGFQTWQMPINLKEGDNQILAKVANRDNANFRAWVFLFNPL